MTGMHSHDGYAPHSHEVRADHLGVQQCFCCRDYGSAHHDFYPCARCGHTRQPANAYEAAVDRMERARRNCQKAKREAERLIREWEAADANLRSYETQAGIPRPEYR